MKKFKSDVQIEGELSIQEPTDDTHAATKSYVDNNVPPPSPSDSDQVVLATQIFN